MLRIMNGEKAKQSTQKTKTKTVIITILWVVLLCAAMAFIAYAGHI